MDGWRGLFHMRRGEASWIVSRNGNRFTKFEALSSDLVKHIKADNVVIDGEVIAYQENGRPLFLDLLRKNQHLAFAAFDILWLDGLDLRPMPLTVRKVYPSFGDHLQKGQMLPETAR
jgi:bifunctional non-homologous end joining protein LigD